MRTVTVGAASPNATICICFPKTVYRHFPGGARKGKQKSELKRYRIYIEHDLTYNVLSFRASKPKPKMPHVVVKG